MSYTLVENFIESIPNLGCHEVITFVAISRYTCGKKRDYKATISIAALKAFARLSESSVKRALKTLEREGVITIHKRFKDQRRLTNTYEINQMFIKRYIDKIDEPKEVFATVDCIEAYNTIADEQEKIDPKTAEKSIEMEVVDRVQPEPNMGSHRPIERNLFKKESSSTLPSSSPHPKTEKKDDDDLSKINAIFKNDKFCDGIEEWTSQGVSTSRVLDVVREWRAKNPTGSMGTIRALKHQLNALIPVEREVSAVLGDPTEYRYRTLKIYLKSGRWLSSRDHEFIKNYEKNQENQPKERMAA